MSRLTVTLDQQLLARLQQVVIDDDADGALKLVKAIHRIIEADKRRQCDPVRLRTSTAVQSITGNREG